MRLKSLLMKIPGVNLLKRARRWLLRRLGRLPAPPPAAPATEPESLPTALDYTGWIAANEPDAAALDAQRKQAAQAQNPLRFAIIYEGKDAASLAGLIRGLQAQTWPYWQLWLTGQALESTDERVHASAQTPADADYLLRVQDSLELAPFALYAAAQAAASQPDAIYADHDELRDGQRTNPFFKPGWSPEMLLSGNNTQPLFFLRADLWQRLQREAPGSPWTQVLQAAEWNLKVVRIPQVLAHLTQPLAEDDLADVEAALRRRGLQEVSAVWHKPGVPHLSWALPAAARVSVIIPTRGSSHMLENCVQSILSRTDYPDYEILLVNNGEKRPEEFPYFAQIQQDARVRVLHHEITPFNYSQINNWAASQASGNYLLFLNNDTRVLNPAWMREMVQWASLPQIGAVGARLLRENGSIQHAGVILGLSGFAGHIFADLPADVDTCYGRVEAYRNYLAVTAACMMVRREVFQQAGGFNEEFILCGNDVEFGLRLNRMGYRVLVNPFVTLEHLESVTHQGNIPAQDFFTSYTYYREALQTGDPYFNPNLSCWKSTPSWRQPGEEDPHQFVQAYIQKLKEQGY